MNKKITLIISFALLIVGAVMLGICIFGNTNTTTPLAIALGCIIVANVLNLIRHQTEKK